MHSVRNICWARLPASTQVSSKFGSTTSPNSDSPRSGLIDTVHGGGVPVRVRGVEGVVAVIVVSGLKQDQDHMVVIEA